MYAELNRSPKLRPSGSVFRPEQLPGLGTAARAPLAADGDGALLASCESSWHTFASCDRDRDAMFLYLVEFSV